MTDQEIQGMNHDQIIDTFHARGIHSTYRSGSDGTVWVIENGKHRPATEEETMLHARSCHFFLMEEAAAGLI